MVDITHGLLKFVDHERYKLLGLLIGVAIVLLTVGCEVAIRSPFTGEKATRSEFKLEAVAIEQDLTVARLQIEQAQLAYNNKVELYNEQKTAGQEQFEEKERLQSGFIEVLGGLATTLATGGAVNPASVLMSVLALGGIGTAVGGVVDSTRKNKVIKKEKAKNGTAASKELT